MGKISDALDKQATEVNRRRVETTVFAPSVTNAPPPVKSPIREGLEPYEDILTRMNTGHPEVSIKSIMFTGAAHGGGATTTAVNFAKALVKNSEAKVLLMDANLRTPQLHNLFNITSGRGLCDILMDNDDKAFKVLKFGPSYLFILAGGGDYKGAVSLFESKRFDEFLKETRKTFDYVVLDGAPLPNSAETRVLCDKVDGVVMVIESGKLRRQVAVRAKQELEDAGARILGVVLNKRKYYIPNWLYKRL
jgi:capsular exopolysaccharide synthesis family protein